MIVIFKICIQGWVIALVTVILQWIIPFSTLPNFSSVLWQRGFSMGLNICVLSESALNLTSTVRIREGELEEEESWWVGLMYLCRKLQQALTLWLPCKVRETQVTTGTWPCWCPRLRLPICRAVDAKFVSYELLCPWGIWNRMPS